MKYLKYGIWESKYQYNIGDVCGTDPSNFYPLYCFECIQEGVSSGFAPTHLSGTEIDGIDDEVSEPDSCWWKFIGTEDELFIKWKPSLNIESTDKYLYTGEKIYKVINPGLLSEDPPYDTTWSGKEFKCGEATLSFVGLKWKVKQWYQKGGLCDCRGNIYQLEKHDGITSGVYPVKGNPYCVDGDIIWKYISGNGDIVDPGPDPGGDGEDNPTFEKTIKSSSSSSEWIDTHIFDIPSNINKLKITVSGNGGTVELAYITNDEPWEEGETIETLEVSSEGGSCVVNVSAGKQIRPVFNYYSGSGIVTIKLEGGETINSLPATSTIPPYKDASKSISVYSSTATAWEENHKYNTGDRVISNGNEYECVFDGKLTLPTHTYFSNISTNIKSTGHIFWFYKGTNITTKEGDKSWTIRALCCDSIVAEAEGINSDLENEYYFGSSSQINPKVILLDFNNF